MKLVTFKILSHLNYIRHHWNCRRSFWGREHRYQHYGEVGKNHEWSKAQRPIMMMMRTLPATRRVFGVRSLWKPLFSLSKYKLKPQPPGGVTGTVNDAYQHGMIDTYAGSAHWTYERLISVALIPLASLPLFQSPVNPILDAAFGVLLLFHCHMGFLSCITDYIPERVYGVWNKIARRLLSLGTFVGMYGVYVIETESNVIFDLVQQLWLA